MDEGCKGADIWHRDTKGAKRHNPAIYTNIFVLKNIVANNLLSEIVASFNNQDRLLFPATNVNIIY